MSKNIEHTHQSKTKSSSTLEDITCDAPPRLYFHPDSETFLFPNADEALAIELDDGLMNNLLAHRVDAELRIDALNQKLASIKSNDIKGLNEKNRLLAELREEELCFDTAVDKLRTEMQMLAPMEKLPKMKLLDDSSKKSAIGLMELIEITGGKKGYKYTYVRSDKIKNHVRRYQINEKDKKTGSKSFITSEKYIDENGKERQRQIIDKEKLKSQLSVGKVNLSVYEKKFIEDKAVTLGKWAEDLNEKLKTSPYKGDNFEFDSQSQLMRWGYGAGFKAGVSPFEVDVRTGKRKEGSLPSTDGKFSAYAGLALAESKSKLTLKLPYDSGLIITYPLDADKIPGGGMGVLGTMRLDIDVILSGSLGVSLAVEAGINFQGNTLSGTPAKSSSKTDPSQREIDVSQRPIEPKGAVELGVFAGAQVSLNVTGSLKWKTPHKSKTQSAQLVDGFSDLAKVSAGVSAQAGIGLSGAIQFTFTDGRVRCLVSGGMCKGIGGKGSLAFDINGQAIFDDFLPTFGYMLRNVDYIKMANIITHDDYLLFCALNTFVPMKGLEAAKQLVEAYQDGKALLIKLMTSWNDKEARVALMENVLNTNGKCLMYAPPESKGNVVALLLTNNFWDEISLASHKGTKCEGGVRYASRKRAILLILSWAQSKRDYENIMQYLSINLGGKGVWQANEARVVAFLEDGEATRSAIQPQLYGPKPVILGARPNIQIEPSHYRKNLAALYQQLPDNLTVQRNSDENQQAPLKQVDRVYVDSCTRIFVGDKELR
ncbi:hypothetical protein [Providencia heimbachae]|uniref:Uncharacterized protein n=1 Tax=Providencia heimbachae ATCC 35613 TaxID=1354272 RepID=A0A1B7K3U9_9GAMM|nr:hypothetical protein [Providencia heimbachae]OAT54819.1 hypothetical protein M998_0243 [Providencia heimbachae ATCC 35613]SQH13298.1 Uncharacterised protein [Providencia heimbachae]